MNQTNQLPGPYSELTGIVIGCAIEVHKILGPGLLESTYETCLAEELRLCGQDFLVQCPVPVIYKSVRLECGYRVDILVDQCLVVELKSVQELSPVHEAQILSYMKMMEAPVGLLINFNVKYLTQGIRRFCL